MLRAVAQRLLVRTGSWLRGLDPALLGAVIVGLLLRTYAFAAIPRGLNQDEASTAYDAYSLIHFGVDRHGFRLPVVLVSWGSGMYALASYVAAPFIGIFGLEVWSARLPHLLAGLSALPLFFVLMRDTIDRRTARIGVVLLAISPWHVMVSRWGLDSNLFPFVFLVATVLFVRSTACPRLLIGAAAGYSLALYSYGTAYVVVPAFLALAVGYGLRHRLWPRRTLLLSAATFVVVAVPVGLYVAVNTFHWSSIVTPFFSIPRLTGVPRFQTVGNFHVFSVAFFRQAAENLAHAVDLFRSQDDGLIWNALPGQGILYWFSSFLAVVGLALLCSLCLGRTPRPAFPVLAWCGASIGLLLFVNANINRANIAMIPFIYCTALAVSHLWQQRALAVLLCLLFGGSVLGFTGAYFGSQRNATAEAFFASFGEAIRYSATQTEGEICVTDRLNMPYIFVLFYNREDPRKFQQTVRYSNPGAEFEGVSSFGRYRFGLGSCADSAPVVVATRDEAEHLPRERFKVTEFERYTVLTRQ